MRRVFLWAARNAWLKEHLPTLPFMQRAVRRFMPGETMASALDAAAPLQAAGIATMYTRLGENLDQPGRGGRGRRPLPRRCSTRSWRAASAARSRSSRPSSGSTTTRTRRWPISSRIAEHAAATGSYLWIDMEGSAYTEATIRLYERLRAVQPRDRDLPAGVPEADRRRHRPAAAARSGDPAGQGRLRRAGRDRLSRQAAGRCQLPRPRDPLPARTGRGRPIRLGLGTHDVELIEQIADSVAPAGIGRDGFEIEMLYGIRTSEQYRLAKAGYRVADAHRLR